MIDRITDNPEIDAMQADAADLAETLRELVNKYLLCDMVDLYPWDVRLCARWMLGGMLTGPQGNCFRLPPLEEV